MGNIQVYIDQAVTLVMAYGPKLLLAILTLFVGLYIIKVLTKTSKRVMKKREIDESLRPFFCLAN
jgi:small conductance mechanosensitive channel